MNSAGIVVVGAGQAGFSLCARLRTSGYEGPVTLIGEEDELPYQRPPLSKAYLLGDMTRERLYFRPPEFFELNKVTLKLGVRVTGIDRKAQRVELADGHVDYAQLALVTGATPRRLPDAMGGNLEGVYVIRNIADIDAAATEFKAGRRILIVGGGYIGLEVAAVARKLDLEVTLVEAAPRILQRVAAEQTSSYFRALHEHHGVKVIEGVGIVSLEGNGRASGALLADGLHLQADFVVMGVGIAPNVELAETAGLEIDNGIRTDARGRTSDPLIWAAGDCASFPYGEDQIRLESVGNAIDQAETVADNMLGAEIDYDAKPWFWSDQYDVKLQIAGLNTGYDTVFERVSNEKSVSFWYYRQDHLLAVDAVNDPRAYMVAKRLIESNRSPDGQTVSDPHTELKSLLA